MISKELLSEVLTYNITDYIAVNNSIYINSMHILESNISTAFGNYEYTINIHELAHKCKEWAKTHEFLIGSGTTVSNNIPWWSDISWDDEDGDTNRTHFHAETEPEAIFKACEWILNDRR